MTFRTYSFRDLYQMPMGTKIRAEDSETWWESVRRENGVWWSNGEASVVSCSHFSAQRLTVEYPIGQLPQPDPEAEAGSLDMGCSPLLWRLWNSPVGTVVKWRRPNDEPMLTQISIKADDMSFPWPVDGDEEDRKPSLFFSSKVILEIAEPVVKEEAPAPNILDEAKALVEFGERSKEYGTPENSFTQIAAYWNAYLRQAGFFVGRTELRPEDVGAMMILLKIARGTEKRDNLLDIAGYARCIEMIQQERENPSPF